MLKIFFYIALLISCAQTSCITENSKIPGIVWRANLDYYSIVLSSPPCLDKEYNLVSRVCSNGSWITNDDCYKVEENNLCPQDFLQHEDFCIYKTEPQTWERQCPYPGASFPKSKVSLGEAWLPIRRITGEFEFVLPGEHYGTEFSSEIQGEKDCAIASQDGVQFINCDSLHPHLCLYKYNQFLYQCPDECVSAGLGSNYCFCKARGRQQTPKEKWCKTLATPKYSYERKILHSLAKNDSCLIGGLQENHRSKIDLAIQKDSWIPYNQEITCAICKVDAISYPKVSLMLKFNSQKLYLKVYFSQSILQVDGEDAVFCFTDATDQLKSRVETDVIYESDSPGRRFKVFDVSISDNGPGNYWCEVFQLSDLSVVRSKKVVAFKEFKGNEYSLRVIIYNLCRFSSINCQNTSIEFLNEISKSLFHDKFFSRFIKKVRVFHVYDIDKENNKADLLLHLSTRSKMPIEAEYYSIARNLNRLTYRQVTVVFFKSSEVCLPETTFSSIRPLHWKLCRIGMVRTPNQVCIQENGTPVRRRCEGDFIFGSKWGEIEGDCSEKIKLSSKTELLYSLVSSEVSTNLTKNISMLTENASEFTALDVYYIAEALIMASAPNANDTKEFINEISKIIDNLMNVNKDAMGLSQNLLNSTDEILDSFENCLLAIDEDEELLIVKRSNLIILRSRPFLNNITGLALYEKSNSSSFLDFEIINLYSNSSFDYLSKDNLELAVYIPETLLRTENLMQPNITVIITIFYRDNFFNSHKSSFVSGEVISVSIPGYGEFLQTDIPIIFKSVNSEQRQECAFWNYGTSSENLTGYWSTLGGNYLGKIDNSSLEICSFSHLTNFALLVTSTKFSIIEVENILYNFTAVNHDSILTIISDVGCLLSVMGILGIFLTSLLFHSWREKVGTKILIQLCITILLQIIFFNLADTGPHNSSVNLSAEMCITIGIILHYVLISEFCWMLVAAVLQFFRFVRVIGPMPNRIILKATLFGWGVPLIPIIVVCAIDYENYSGGIQGFCYPKGMTMYFAILLPIALIVGANLIVFVSVIRNVFILSVEPSGNHSQSILKRQICLAILLFSLLGLPWIFGLLAEVLDESILSIIFIYLFCITATIQGFILFLFYVVLDKSTRNLWFTLFKRTLDRKLC